MVSFCLIIQQSFWLWKRKWASLFGAQRESRQNIRPPSGPRAGRCYQTTTWSKRLFTPTKPLKHIAENLVHKHTVVRGYTAESLISWLLPCLEEIFCNHWFCMTTSEGCKPIRIHYSTTIWTGNGLWTDMNSIQIDAAIFPISQNVNKEAGSEF